MKAIYFEQYGYFWKTDIAGAKKVMQGIISGKGFDLGEHCKPLKRRPSKIYKHEDGRFGPKDNSALLIQSLDYDREDALEMLNELNEGKQCYGK